MLNILRIYKAVPYTTEALKLLSNGWKVPEGLHVPSLDERTGDLTTRLDATKQALLEVEQLIGNTGSEAEQIVLHNAVRLPIIQLRQQLTNDAMANMPRTTVDYSAAKQIVEDILYAAIKKSTGSPHVAVNDIHGFKDEVDLVSSCLLNAEGQDHDTHGVSRVLDYAQAIIEGRINPKGKVELIKEEYGKLSFTGGGTFGQVAAQIALQEALEYMRDKPGGSLTVTMRNAYHAGRLEWILRQAVREGYSCLAMFNVGGWGRTAPEPDGMEPRWGTNPIGLGVPTNIGEDGCVGDLATTARPEGWVRVAYLNNLIVPLDVLRTPDGYPTIDPAGVYREDDIPDLLLPIGGEVAAYKGAVLGEQVELFTDAVSGRKPGEVSHPKGNNLVLFLCKGDDDVFASTREKLALIESCRTASGNPVRRPGGAGMKKHEESKVQGLSIASGTWQKVMDLHGQLCCAV